MANSAGINLKKTLVSAALAIAAIGTAGAQSFPSKLIRFIGIATPGSTTDVIGRAVADPLTRQIGQQIVVENRGGGGGTIAANAVVRSEPDGYTVLLTSSAQTGMPWLYNNLGFDPIKDFSGVTPLAELPSVLVVSPQRGWNTLKDLIAAGKARPGALNFGSGGTGSGTHLSSEKLMLAAGITANHVPYKGTSEGLIEVAAGRLDWFFSPAAAAMSLVKDGRLKGLAISAKTRMPLLPDIPTTVEAGVADADYVFWVGLMVPRKTPRQIVNKLNEEIARVLHSAELRERFRQMGAEPFSMKPDEFDAFIAAATESTGRIVKAANIKPQ